MVGCVTVCCVLLDVGDKDVIDGRDRGRIVCENRQLRREKESLVKEKKMAERREKRERLLRVGYAINQGGQERVSVV